MWVTVLLCVCVHLVQVISPTSFVRPIYAGNGLASVSVAPDFQSLIMATVSAYFLLDRVNLIADIAMMATVCWVGFERIQACMLNCARPSGQHVMLIRLGGGC